MVEKSPLQVAVSNRMSTIRAITEMSRLKNILFNLSPETREAWKTFKDLVWKDIRFQQSQIDLYKTEKLEGKNEVIDHNQIERRKANLVRVKEMKEAREKKFFEEGNIECRKCHDTGETSSGSRIMYCTCPKGIKALRAHKHDLLLNQHPNWAISEGLGSARCLDCKRVFSEGPQYHTCSGLDNIERDKRFTAKVSKIQETEQVHFTTKQYEEEMRIEYNR